MEEQIVLFELEDGRIETLMKNILEKIDSLNIKINNIEKNVEEIKTQIQVVISQKLIKEDERVLNRAIRTYAKGSEPIHFVPART